MSARPRLRQRRARIAIVLAAGIALAGCSPLGGPAYEADAAERLQQHVLAVTTSAADGEWETALVDLMELEAAAKTALARGEITEARADAILAALALVRADVEAAAAGQPSGDGGGDDNGSDNAPGDGGGDEPAPTGPGSSNGNGGGKPDKDD